MYAFPRNALDLAYLLIYTLVIHQLSRRQGQVSGSKESNKKGNFLYRSTPSILWLFIWFLNLKKKTIFLLLFKQHKNNVFNNIYIIFSMDANGQWTISNKDNYLYYRASHIDIIIQPLYILTLSRYQLFMFK